LAWTYNDILKVRYEDVQNEQAAINAEIERCRIAEDNDGLMAAIERHDSNQVRMQSLNNAAQAMQRQPNVSADFAGTNLKRDEIEVARRYGLSAKQMEAAMSVTADASYNPEDRARCYIQGLKRVADARANGYRDEVDLHNPGRR
jgi:hypothetical protein